MPDDDAVNADEDLLDEEPQDALTFDNRGGFRGVAQPHQEALDGLGKREIALTVQCLRRKCVELRAEDILLFSQRRHPLAQFIQRQQRILVRCEQPCLGSRRPLQF